jgi:hypothetical protein
MSRRKSRVVTLTWTGTISATSTLEADDGPTVIYLGGAERASVQLDTTGATTGSPDFDLHALGTNSNSWPTTAFQADIITAQAKNVLSVPIALTLGPRYLKIVIDVNTADLASSEYVQAFVYIDADDAGRLVDSGMN